MVFSHAEARERRSGEIPIKALVKDPERVKPGSRPKSDSANHTRPFPGLLSGVKPRNRNWPVLPGAISHGNNSQENGKWVLPDGNIPDTRLEQDSERKIPGALPV
jgi:hypothetical protein